MHVTTFLEFVGLQNRL